MKTLNEENRQRVFNFLNSLNTEIDITNFVNCEDLETEDFSDNMFQKIVDIIEDNNGFEQEVMFYASAMDYLRENDPSLRESLELAHDLGFTADNLNSEILASILKTDIVREEFNQLEDEINTFFLELKNEE